MPYLVGIDEAGYGPNLGPLTISTTVWWMPDDPWDVDLYERLAKVVTRTYSPDDERLAIADSKQLYTPRLGLGPLERGLLPALALADGVPRCWQAVWDVLGADPDREREALAWHAGYDLALPLAVEPAEVERRTKALACGLRAAGVRLERIRSRAVFPERFNALIEKHGTKGAALSTLSLELLAETLAACDEEPALVVCDKHGGRNRYGPLLQAAFPERLVEVGRESRALSVYRWGRPQARVEVRFSVGAESFLPAALASMACKYLRELSMRAFNDYWCACVPNLRPTAGYPVDARRFKREIAAAQQGLGIDDRVLWRSR